MRRLKTRTRVLAGCVVASLLFGLGCEMLQPKEEGPSQKQARLIAAENIQLKGELETCQDRIRTLEAQHAQQLKEQKDLVAQCQEQKQVLQKRLEEGIAQQVGDVTKTLISQSAELRQQLEAAQAETQTLRQQLQEAKLANASQEKRLEELKAEIDKLVKQLAEVNGTP